MPAWLPVVVVGYW